MGNSRKVPGKLNVMPHTTTNIGLHALRNSGRVMAIEDAT
jgi:hypothetical protein